MPYSDGKDTDLTLENLRLDCFDSFKARYSFTTSWLDTYTQKFTSPERLSLRGVTILPELVFLPGRRIGPLGPCFM